MEYCLPVRISQSVEYQLPRPRPPMLRVPTALTSSSLPGLMWGSRASPGDGRVSVLLAVLTCLAASLICFLVAFGSPGIGFSAGTSAGACALSAGAVGCVWGAFWGGVDCVGVGVACGSGGGGEAGGAWGFAGGAGVPEGV